MTEKPCSATSYDYRDCVADDPARHLDHRTSMGKLRRADRPDFIRWERRTELHDAFVQICWRRSPKNN
ncbi:hypothetical protein ACFQ2K_54435 [Streptomyces sanglieri]|uniref:Uncharacterized protein n=1 Tax=Streptomyces sanglieri TaxID=193460 RepID=A0ABW2XAZ5_9ACTN